jgi:UPF0271 protein
MKFETPRLVILLDTSAFIAGYGMAVEEEYYTVPAIWEELSKKDLKLLRFEAALEARTLKIQVPDQSFQEDSLEIIANMGEKGSLSEADVQLLALALEFKTTGSKPIILTDDYGIQNVAHRMGIDYRSLVTHGINRRLKWAIYCPGCRKEFPEIQNNGLCLICGTKLKRKPVSIDPVK